jgi:hypothetical protein
MLPRTGECTDDVTLAANELLRPAEYSNPFSYEDLTNLEILRRGWNVADWFDLLYCATAVFLRCLGAVTRNDVSS